MSPSFRLLPCVLFALVILCATPGGAQHDGLDADVARATLVKTGQTAPDFTCQTTAGETFTLSAQKGKVVLLYFFDKVPAACGAELGYIEKEISQSLARRDDFVILGIGRRLTREEVVRMAGESHANFPLAADTGAEVFAKYFTGFVPRCVIVNGAGRIVYLKTGYHEFDGIVALKSVLAAQLAGK